MPSVISYILWIMVVLVFLGEYPKPSLLLSYTKRKKESHNWDLQEKVGSSDSHLSP